MSLANTEIMSLWVIKMKIGKEFVDLVLTTWEKLITNIQKANVYSL